jgi:hypothetical protein
MPASRRSSLLAAAFAGALLLPGVGPVALAPHAAHASTAVALSVDDLVDRSEAIVVAIPKSKVSRWESGRIVTYTTVAVDTAVAGSGKAGGTVVVRTYGGVVDGIGQITHGEANLVIDRPIVLFLRTLPAPATKTATPKVTAGSMVITGMAQGALPVEIGADKIARVIPRPVDLNLVPQPQLAPGPLVGKPLSPAVVALANRPLTEVVGELRTVWAARGKK